MRKTQIEPAAVDIERLAEMLDRHRGALDMPARPALAPRAIPRRLAGLGALPECEVAGAFLFRARLHARAGFEFLGVEAAEFAIVVVAGHVEIDIAVGRVGEALLDQAGDRLDHVRDVFGRLREEVDARHVEPLQALVIIGGHFLGEFLHAGLQFAGALISLSSTSVMLTIHLIV